MTARLLRTRNGAPLAAAIALMLSASLHPEIAAADLTQLTQFNIPPQQLSDALLQYSRQSGVQVTSRAEIVESKTSPGVSGTLPARQALDRLLQGTKLIYDVIGDNTVTIREAEARSSSRDAADNPGDARVADVTAPDTAAREESRATRAGDIAPVPRSDYQVVEEIIVTAQKRVERLQDVPVPVSTIDGATLTASSQLRLQDYYSRVPGLNLTLLGNGSTPIVTIRGITTGGGTNPSVGVVVDEVPYGNTISSGFAPTVPDIDPGDLARVEVLRGPQGTLYGASSIGGLVNFVTVEPSTERMSGRIQVGTSAVAYGDIGHSLRGSINLPLAGDLAVRASAFTIRDPGFVDNVTTGDGDINGRDSDGGRLAVLWRPSARFSLRLGALAQESERQGTSDVDPALGRFRQAALIGTGGYGRSTEAYSLTMNGLLGRLDWTSVTGYNVDDVTSNRDASAVSGGFFRSQAMSIYGVGGAGIPASFRNCKFSEELRLALPIGETVDWLLGAFYTDEERRPVNDIVAVDTGTGDNEGLLLGTANPGTYRERAVFTNVTFDLTQRFDLQLGARFAESEQSFYGVRSGPLSLAFFGANPSITPTVASEDDALTYLFTPRLRLSPDLMLYARIASGYRPGGPNASCGIAGIPCQYDPDTTTNYELGAKGAVWDGRLAFDASVYSIDWRDIQIQLQTTFGFIDNVGRARSRGLEISLDARPVDGLEVRGWFAWNDAELTRDFPSTSAVRGRAGDRLPYSSEYSANLSLDREFPFWNGSTAAIGGLVSYVGEREGAFQPSTAREAFPAYTQVDVHAAVRFERWTLTAFANNITDERGVLRSGLDSLDPDWVTYIDPRTVGISLTVTF